MWQVYKSEVARSVPFDNSTNGFTASNVQTAIEEAKLSAEGFPRAGIRSCYNSTVGASTWLGPSELLPNTPLLVAPVNLKINEISWSNQITNVQFRIQFRTVSRTGTIFYTLTVTSPNNGSGFVSGINFTLPAGTQVHAQYLDDGTNCSDMDLILWVSRTN
jgi:hypothetical protein